MNHREAPLAGAAKSPASAGLSRAGARISSQAARSVHSVTLNVIVALAFIAGVSMAPSSPGALSAGTSVELLVAAIAPAIDGPEVAALTQEELDAALSIAVSDWQLVVPDADLGSLAAELTDLPDLELASTDGTLISVDPLAAGHGFVSIDLLTVLRHEIGHVLGHDHAEAGLMAESLEPGVVLDVSDLETPAPSTEEPADEPATGVIPPESETTASAVSDPSDANRPDRSRVWQSDRPDRSRAWQSDRPDRSRAWQSDRPDRSRARRSDRSRARRSDRSLGGGSDRSRGGWAD